METWKSVKGYEGLYEVSNLGNVRSLRYNNTNKISPLKVYIEKAGYARVSLSKNGKSKNKRIHRLVAEAFIPNMNSLPQVNHIDGNKLNNNVKNLEWCSASRNQKHKYEMGLMVCKTGKAHHRTGKTGKENVTSKTVKCVTTGEIFDSAHDASRKYNLNFSNICSCCRGNRNYCGKLSDGTKLKWEYLKTD